MVPTAPRTHVAVKVNARPFAPFLSVNFYPRVPSLLSADVVVSWWTALFRVIVHRWPLLSRTTGPLAYASHSITLALSSLIPSSSLDWYWVSSCIADPPMPTPRQLPLYLSRVLLFTRVTIQFLQFGLLLTTEFSATHPRGGRRARVRRDCPQPYGYPP